MTKTIRIKLERRGEGWLATAASSDLLVRIPGFQDGTHGFVLSRAGSTCAEALQLAEDDLSRHAMEPYQVITVDAEGRPLGLA